MAGALGALVVSLGLDAAEFVGGLSKSEFQARKFVGTLERDLSRAARGVTSALSLLGSSIAGISLTAFVQGQVNAIDKLNDVRDATGGAIEKLSALDDLARANGTSFDTASSALVRLNTQLNASEPGKGVDLTLKSIGLSAAELKKQDPTDALVSVAEALARYADGPNKARIVTELFGKSVKEVAPLLKDLAEQGLRAGTITTAQAQAAEDFNKKLAALRTTSENYARTLALELIPSLTKFFDNLNKSGGITGSIAARLGLDQQGKLESAAAAIRQELNTTIDSIERMQTELNRQGGDNPRLANSIEKARAKAADLQRQAGQTAEALKALANGLAPLGQGRRPANEGGGGLRLPDAPDTGGGGGGAPKSRPMVDEALLQGYDQLEQMRLSVAAVAESWNTVDAATKRATESVQAWVAAQETAADDGTTGGIDQVIRDLQRVNDESMKAKGQAQELGLSFASAFERAIVDGERLGDVLKGLLKDILQIIVRRAIVEPVANFVTQAISGTRATGGPVEAGKAYMVGERGPEPFVPSVPGRILPNGGGFGGGSVDVQLVNQSGAPLSARAQVQQSNDKRLVRVLLREVGRDFRSGSGPASSGLRQRGVSLAGGLPVTS